MRLCKVHLRWSLAPRVLGVMMHATRRSVALGLLGAVGVGLASRPVRAAGKTLRIGFQKYGTLVILRYRGTLETALAPLGWSVTWTEFPGGPQLLEALNAGSIDFGIAGETPPVFAQAAEAPLLYVGVEPPAPRGEAILVKNDSPIRGLADLRGKRVALNKGSNVHFLLVQALKAAGLGYADIQPVYLTPADGRAAFEQGSADAWVIWDPYLASAQADLATRVLVDGTGIAGAQLAPNHQFFLSTTGLARESPDIVRLLLRQLDTVDHWAEANQGQAAALLAPPMGLPIAVVSASLARMGYGVLPMSPEVVANQQRIADAFTELHLLPHRLVVRDAVWAGAA
jgi:sulfonate transport system substrate-binding protein